MKKEERKVVGAYLPHHIIHFISLFALHTETTKSTVIRDLIEYWYKDKTPIFKEEKMLENLTTRFQNLWDGRKSLIKVTEKQKTQEFEKFQTEITTYLIKKGCGVFVEKIMNDLRI